MEEIRKNELKSMLAEIEACVDFDRRNILLTKIFVKMTELAKDDYDNNIEGIMDIIGQMLKPSIEKDPKFEALLESVRLLSKNTELITVKEGQKISMIDNFIDLTYDPETSNGPLTVKLQKPREADTRDYLVGMTLGDLLKAKTDKKRVFVQGSDLVYRSKDGYTVVEELTGTGLGYYVMRDPDDKVVIRDAYALRQLNKVLPCEFFSYRDRYERRPGIQKWSPSHFKVGSLVKVFDPTEKKHVNLTVMNVAQSGPRSFCFNAFNKHPKGHALAGMHIGYNIFHVDEFVFEGVGPVEWEADPHRINPTDYRKRIRDGIKAEFEHRGFVPPKLKKGEEIFHHVDSIAAILVREMGLSPEHNFGYINLPRWMNFVRHMNLGREIFVRSTLPPSDKRSGRDEAVFMVLNIPKTRKWLKNNSHRIFYSLDYVEKAQEEDYRRARDEDSY